ncbi:MAG: NUDIX domain-containing protein, partial [Candidatus Riesia sp.]|nr:NUDIX domain-containing protein [Candidatus Riesia sp.]
MEVGVDYIGVGTTCITLDELNRVILLRRSEACRDEQGKWECAGGAMDFGEKSLEGSIAREIKEELGAPVFELKRLKLFSNIRETEKGPTHWVTQLFAGKVFSWQAFIAEPEKANGLAFVPLTSFVHLALGGKTIYGIERENLSSLLKVYMSDYEVL